MRRADLTVDTTAQPRKAHNVQPRYELSQSPSIYTARRTTAVLSPRSSATVDSVTREKSLQRDVEARPASPTPRPSSQKAAPAYKPLQPSIRLLFSFLSSHDLLVLIVPALVFSVVSGGVAPFMTIVVGDVFDAFAHFPTSDATQDQRDKLLHSVGISALELLALAVGAIALSSVTSALWISTGERNIMRLRTSAYRAVSTREMEWFDTKMGGEDASDGTANEGDGPVGAGGLMAKFNRDTDDVRMASSLAFGMLVQYLTTCIACLVIAFVLSFKLTLVILSTAPTIMIVQVVSQRFAGPLVNAERDHTVVAASLIERAVNAIATVKAFNAQAHERAALDPELDSIDRVTIKANGVWGITSGMSQFVSMAMFVQGFWFGAKLVRDGSASAGNVMAVFWACLIAASNIQLCIPQLITIAKGKFAMVSLLTIIKPPPSEATQTEPSRASNGSMTKPVLTDLPANSKLRKWRKSSHSHTQSQSLRKIEPKRCHGEFSLFNVSFAYPSRPSQQVLHDISLFFPASETTFVVGGSGSGKSTIAQLLAQLYQPTWGTITFDEQDTAFLSEPWLRRHVALVSQSCILFEGTVHENVAMGVAGRGKKKVEDVSREEVVRVCRAALMHDFVRELPEGYETRLGQSGTALSGGQKQRLAIARALLREPTVLILDEATSALDATSRVLVFEAIKAWRRNRTTIVITHDLSQITPEDFVHVLKDGSLVEQGYRSDLELPQPDGTRGEFRSLMMSQGEMGGFPTKRESEIYDDWEGDIDGEEVGRILEEEDREKEGKVAKENRHLSALGLPGQGTQGLGISGYVMDVVSDLKRSKSTMLVKKESSLFLSAAAPGTHRSQDSPALSKHHSMQGQKKKKRGSIRRHFSLQFTPNSPEMQPPSRPPRQNDAMIEDDEDFEFEKNAVKRSGLEANRRREHRGDRHRQDLSVIVEKMMVPTDVPTTNANTYDPIQNASFVALLRQVYPTVANKPVIFVGLLISVVSGAMTPVFSFLLSKLLFEVSVGATDVRTINLFGGLVLAVAAIDSIFVGLKFFVNESGAMSWITRLRKLAYTQLLSQDKSYFDKEGRGAPMVVQSLMKDGDDARNLIAVVLSQGIAVCTMGSVGLIWALESGWQLTLAGLAIGPIFAVTMAFQANLVAKAERNNKLAREEVAKGYYECISNIRAIRCMSFETVFLERFEASVQKAYSVGIRGAFVEGCTFGVANGLIYLAEALLFFVGAVLVANGTYSYLRMVQVLNLVVFTVTIGSQLMGFTQKIACATQATRDLLKILSLPSDTEESQGKATPAINGHICMNDVSFAYPERPDVPVLLDVSLELRRNETVALVGASGSGKSTIAALLERLYEPSAGVITLDGVALSSIDINHLRAHISIISQNPNLFDSSIAANIAYGNPGLSRKDIRRAAKAAHVHDFIMSLPQGYDTHLGQNASLISGGQAQRLALARALSRPARILILDECTSALDPASQEAVLISVRDACIGRTAVMVTHKLKEMRMCERIVVLDEGRVVEEGSFEALIDRRGVFARLARAGEWES